MRGDADTVGAITGQLAGAIYGLGETPAHWRQAVNRYGAGTHLLRLVSRSGTPSDNRYHYHDSTQMGPRRDHPSARVEAVPRP